MTATVDRPIRCAIYTRKSTEEGLDREFNSLEAQRESCENYIKSQTHEGWVLIPTAYDDGGFTGGNMERPALKALMADIKAGRVDNIVVYKVDRLSRSLHDFAQMVQVFDTHKVSFVSITQQFNTTNSMGRLTLNILLSFAQFEREVIGERVRDKIAASKQKGMWMGGHPPLGYDIEHRKLVINTQEAQRVNELFGRYLEMQSAYKLADFLCERGDVNKRWINRHGVDSGGQPFSYQALYKILNNPVYIGRISHKDKTFPGQHQAIISIELWDRVQASLKEGRVLRNVRHARNGALLMGKCFTPDGNGYTPTHTRRGTVQHRYYIDKKTQHRVKAIQIESLIIDTLNLLSTQKRYWRDCWTMPESRLLEEEAQHRWEALWASWSSLSQTQVQEVMRQIVERIVITADQITVRLNYAGILGVLPGVSAAKVGRQQVHDKAFQPDILQGDGWLQVTIAARFKTYGRRQMALDAGGKAVRAFKRSTYNPVLVNALVKSYRWNQQLEAGKASITQLAKENGYGRTYVSRMVNMMMLAPDIITAILNGTQPATLQLQDLMGTVPIEWHRQRKLFKFPDLAA